MVFWTILKYHSRYYCQIPLQVVLLPILKSRTKRYSLVIFCNRVMCLYKNETHEANYCTFKLKETNLSNRQECFTGKYTTRKFRTKAHPGLEWRIFHILTSDRLDFQPFCEPAFLAPHRGWITNRLIVFFEQSQSSLVESSRLGCDWSILSLVYPKW